MVPRSIFLDEKEIITHYLSFFHKVKNCDLKRIYIFVLRIISNEIS